MAALISLIRETKRGLTVNLCIISAQTNNLCIKFFFFNYNLWGVGDRDSVVTVYA